MIAIAVPLQSAIETCRKNYIIIMYIAVWFSFAHPFFHKSIYIITTYCYGWPTEEKTNESNERLFLCYIHTIMPTLPVILFLPLLYILLLLRMSLRLFVCRLYKVHDSLLVDLRSLLKIRMEKQRKLLHFFTSHNRHYRISRLVTKKYLKWLLLFEKDSRITTRRIAIAMPSSPPTFTLH